MQVSEEKTGEVLYTLRVPGKSFQPPGFAPGEYTIKVGRDRPNQFLLKGIKGAAQDAAKLVSIKLG